MYHQIDLQPIETCHMFKFLHCPCYRAFFAHASPFTTIEVPVTVGRYHCLDSDS